MQSDLGLYWLHAVGIKALKTLFAILLRYLGQPKFVYKTMKFIFRLMNRLLTVKIKMHLKKNTVFNSSKSSSSK